MCQLIVEELFRFIRKKKLMTSSTPPKTLNLLRRNHHRTSPSLNDHRVITETVKILQSSTCNELEQTNYNSLNNLLSPNTNSRLHLKIIRHVSSSSDALKFLKYLKQNATSPSHSLLSSAFQIVLELANRELNSDHNLYSLYNISKQWNIPLTVNSVTILLNRFLRSGFLEESLSLFNEFERKNAHVCNVIIGLLLKNDRVDYALKVFDEMPQLRAKGNSRVNCVTRSLFLGYVLGKEGIVDVKENVGLLFRLGEREIFPSSFQLTILITRLCSGGESNAGWDLLWGLMELGGRLETVSCNALFTGFGKEKNFERTRELMAKMNEHGIRPDVVTCGIVINYMCKYGKIDEAMQVFYRMCDGDRTDGVSVEPDVVIYNTLIDGLCKVGRREEGLHLLERMRMQKGCDPNTVTYNCLIDGFCKVGEIEKGRELFEQMKNDGVLADVITVNTLLDGMCTRRRINCAVQFFDELQVNGLKGDAVSSSILIKALCDVNNINKAEEIFSIK